MIIVLHSYLDRSIYTMLLMTNLPNIQHVYKREIWLDFAFKYQGKTHARRVKMHVNSFFFTVDEPSFGVSVLPSLSIPK